MEGKEENGLRDNSGEFFFIFKKNPFLSFSRSGNLSRVSPFFSFLSSPSFLYLLLPPSISLSLSLQYLVNKDSLLLTLGTNDARAVNALLRLSGSLLIKGQKVNWESEGRERGEGESREREKVERKCNREERERRKHNGKRESIKSINVLF